jgi:hypothetical protein
MRPLLLSAFVALLATNALCQDPAGGGGAANPVEERARLKVQLAKALEEGDLIEQDKIDRLYQAGPASSLIDLLPLYEARYEALGKLVGTPDEDKEMDSFGRICDFVRKTGASTLSSKLEKDYTRTNPYTFPEHLRMAGWPMPGDPHQFKGLRGQILGTLVAIKDKEFLKDHIRKTDALAADADEKLLGIWALGYSVLPEGDEYLRIVAATGSKREKALAASALNYLVLQMATKVRNGIPIDNDRRASLEKFLADHYLASSVTAGEYYPF